MSLHRVRPSSLCVFLALCTALALGCGDDDGTVADAGSDAGSVDGGSMDAGTTGDDASAEDASAEDASTEDASTEDASTEDASGMDAATSDGGTDAGAAPDDAGPDGGFVVDAPGACHGYTFGRGPVALESLAALPATLGGGEIPVGSFDLVRAETSGALRGMVRGTWVFEAADLLQRIDAFTTGPTLPEPNPRTETVRTEGTRLLRGSTCFGTDTFDNQYEVRVTGGGTLLLVLQGSLLFTYQLRE